MCLLIFLMCSCNGRTVHFYSLDKSQCVTVIDRGDIRYVVNGKHKKIPNSDYIKLDMSNTDRILRDFRICWKNELYQWKVVVNNAKVVESKIDESRFVFSSELPNDDRGIPTEIEFRQDNCAVFSFYLMKLSPERGAIVEIL